uniref:MCF2L n=1 Tax=Ursus maritimus TaxID=29073 RepID=A0A452V7C5_URSMA
MKSYYVYSEWCSWLLSVAEDEIMHQDITPLCAADIQDQLKKRFAYLSGGRGQDGSPVITFPDYPAFGDVPDKEFQNVMTYLTSIPRMSPFRKPGLQEHVQGSCARAEGRKCRRLCGSVVLSSWPRGRLAYLRPGAPGSVSRDKAAQWALVSVWFTHVSLLSGGK